MATTTNPVPPAADAGRADTSTPKAPKTPKPASNAAKAEIKMAQDLVNRGVPLETAIDMFNALKAGKYADSDAYFAAHPFTPVTRAARDLSTHNVPAAPDFGGYLNLQYAYKYLLSMGDSAQDAEEYVVTMATLAGLTRDARTYIGNGSTTRRCLRVPAARLPA